MISYIRRLRMRSKARAIAEAESQHQETPEAAGDVISASLEANVARVKDIMGNTNDFVLRPFLICAKRKAALMFVDGLVKSDTVLEAVLRPLMVESRLIRDMDVDGIHSMDDILQTFVLSGETKVGTNLNAAIGDFLGGDAVLLVDGIPEALSLSVKGWERRAISEPQTDTVVRGPRDGFTETLRTNTSMIRRRLKTPDLRMEMYTVGERTQTQVCLLYLESLANPVLVEKVRKRINSISTDAILNSGYIEEFISDAPFSLYQTTGYTEKPDVVAGKLLEGRTALVVDGTPFVLTMPLLFIEHFQTAEDYALPPYIATSLRITRLIAYIISLLAPAAYVALTTFHQELIPTPLLFTMAASSEGLPFPAIVETTIMLLAFEMLKEAGVRLPKPIGQTISIVGALIMGQAAVQAGIVGAPVVIIVAFTAVTGFVSPSIADSTSTLRWYLLILAGIMGGFGITIGLITILIHMASLKSFGSDYMAPFAPFYLPDLERDSIFRAPHWKMTNRPAAVKPRDMKRQKSKMPRFNDENGPGTEGDAG